MKSILIIGASEFGKHIAEKFSELKNEIRIVDKDESAINALSAIYEDTLIGDCRDIHVVEQLGVPTYDICVVSVGGDFQASLEITSNLKELGAVYIVSQCRSDSQTKFLQMAGADKTVYPQKEAAEKIAYLCNEDGLIDYISISEEIKIVKIAVPPVWVGKELKELNIRQKYELNVLAIEKDKKVTTPTAETVFCKGDCVLVLGSEKKIHSLLRYTKKTG